MRVSAVITAYNSEGFIAEAISSVLEQTCPVDEILVVDDGSTDRTREIVESFSQKGVRYIYQANQGPGAARNLGIQETSGEFLAFLDGDDVWLKDKNEMQSAFLVEHPEVGLVSGFAWWWDTIKDQRFISGETPKSFATLRSDMLVYNKIGNPSRVTLRRSVLTDVGTFNENIRWGQDWELWIRIVARHNAAILPKPVIVYRWHEKNLSHTRRWDRLYSYWNVSKRAIQTTQLTSQRPLLMLRSWSIFTHRRAKYMIRENGPRWQAIAYAVAAFFSYPFEMSRKKFKTLVQAFIGNRLFEVGKRFLRSRVRARGSD